ncbi:GH25 family lysozyme [Nocardia sp. NPDC051052]|uniref:GH25 family lysozyme n=1 Tax=Nocardia sp. NPDC051052 TaxID=3364322 RepID=UPI0037B57945
MLAAYCVVALVGLLPSSVARADSVVEGIDVAAAGVDWAGVQSKGAAFAYIKATQGRDGVNAAFAELISGATTNGLFHGAFHVAAPDTSNGVDQANYFVDHGGVWTPDDDHTLPGAILLQGKGKAHECYGLDPAAMVRWLKDFSNTYRTRSADRPPVIATTVEWWKTCTGDSGDFGSVNPLWILHSAGSADALPAGWLFSTITQYKVSGPNRGMDKFAGDQAALKQFATTT